MELRANVVPQTMNTKVEGLSRIDELKMNTMTMHDSNNAYSSRVSTSVCSDSASNYPTFHSKGKHQQSEVSSYLNETDEEEEEEEEDYDDLFEDVHVQGNAGAKRSRIEQVHTLSERRRGYKINKKMRALRKLIPNCNKVDKASVLDEAIEYLKALQLQAKIMSMGCMSQMMLHTRMQQLHVPYLPHFSTLSIEMGMRMAMCANYHETHFPTPQSMIPSTRFPIVGVPGDLPPMSLSTANFIPFLGGSSAQSVLMGNVSRATSTVEHPS